MFHVKNLIAPGVRPYLLSSEQSVLEASKFFRDSHIGGAPVVNEHNDLVGFCSERDLVYRVIAQERDVHTTLVRDVMSRDVVTAEMDSRIEDCERIMREAHVRHLPVLEEGRVIACLSLRDLLRCELDDSTNQVERLSKYIRGEILLS